MEGWIKLHRKLCDNTLWLSEPFTKGQAWVDLLMLSNHEYSFFFKRGNKVEVNRGQIGRSEVELSDRWKWSRSKVRKFLNDLEKEQQIVQHKNTVTLVVTIVNYELYQEKEQQTEQQKDSRKTAERQQKDTYKNDKNDKNVEEEKNSYSFDEFWKDYGKPIDKHKCSLLFSKLSSEEKELIKKRLPNYLSGIREKRFQKNPQTYLNGKCWNDIEDVIEVPLQLNFSETESGGIDFSFKPKY